MLHRRRAPLFAGFAPVIVAAALGTLAVTLTGPAGSARAQVPGAAPPAAPAAAAPASAGVSAGVAPSAALAADGYTVSGVKVDVSAANANAARDQAIREAQVKAWAEMYKRLVPNAATAPKVSDNDLARLVQGFEIDDEKVSATRYLGSITVRFRPNAVRDMLGGAAQQYVEPPARPFVVLPVTVTDGRAVLWEDRTAWREAWESRQPGGTLVPIVVPDGELSDISAIGVSEALAGNPEALARIAQRYNAAGVIVAKTELPSGGPDLGRPLTVDVTRYAPDGSKDQQTVNVKADMSDRTADFLGRAVTFTTAAVDESWRRENTMPTGPEQATLVRVPLSSLNDWVETRKRLAGVQAITRTDVVSLSRYEAVVALTHRGDVERLRQALARRDLGLTRSGVPAMPGAVPPGQPGMPGMVQPVSDWQLQVLPHGAGADAASSGAVAPAVAPTPLGAPQAAQPAAGGAYGGAYGGGAYGGAPAVAPGAPPRVLGTLPATGANRY